jgi:hypothetical protein
MANTLKFGNGEWYGKKDTILAYNDENNNYKPLPFDFSRGSTPTGSKATTINKDGLIETVGNNVPRIDYKDNTKGALLLEPSRSNLITYSEDFSQGYWTKSGSSVVSGFVSPNGTLNANKLVENTSSGNHQVYRLSANSNNTYSISIFAKKGERDKFRINMGNDTHYADFNLSNGTIINQIGATTTSKIDLISNGWYRCSISYTELTGAPTYNLYRLLDNNGNASYQGDGSSGIYIYGAQIEQGSYATSYIPTSGGVVTRLADSCDNGGNEQVFNDSEGVLYAEVKGFEEVPTSSGYITISSPSVSFTNAAVLQFRNNGDLRFYFGGSATENIQFIASDINLSDNNKIAVQYDSNGSNYKLFVNGVSISRFSLATNQSVTGLSELNLNYSNLGFIGEVKDVITYNTALTDQELIALTTI